MDPLSKEQAATYYIQNLKRLLDIAEEEEPFLLRKEEVVKNKLHLKKIFHESDSSDSKYSNEDRFDKDHTLGGEPALLHSMKKFKNANVIKQKNQLIGKDKNTSHLVHYFNEINNKMIIPKTFGMIHRYKREKETEINLKEAPLQDEYATAFSNAVGRAKLVQKIFLNSCQLNDEKAIQIVKKMDLAHVKHLDLSFNANLTSKFYIELSSILTDEKCMLERLELEGNKIGDKNLTILCAAVKSSPRLQFLNVSKCEITDKGAYMLAHLIRNSKSLEGVIAHYNRIMGSGGVAIANAVAESVSLKTLDLSFNSICGSGKFEPCPEEEEEETKEVKKDGKKVVKKEKKKKKKAGNNDLGGIGVPSLF